MKMDSCDENLILCANVSGNDTGYINATSSPSTIYAGSCKGLVKNDKNRWCYHKSLNTNICCGNEPSDCCTIATTRVIFSSFGSSVLIILLLVLMRYTYRVGKKIFSSISVTTYQPAPKRGSTTYVPHSSAAVAAMRNQQNRRNNRHF
jgi:hypothetical protein